MRLFVNHKVDLIFWSREQLAFKMLLIYILTQNCYVKTWLSRKIKRIFENEIGLLIAERMVISRRSTFGHVSHMMTECYLTATLNYLKKTLIAFKLTVRCVDLCRELPSVELIFSYKFVLFWLRISHFRLFSCKRCFSKLVIIQSLFLTWQTSSYIKRRSIFQTKINFTEVNFFVCSVIFIESATTLRKCCLPVLHSLNQTSDGSMLPIRLLSFWASSLQPITSRKNNCR